MHTDLAVKGAGDPSVPPGQQAGVLEIGGFMMCTFEKGAALRFVPDGQRFMNASQDIFLYSVVEAGFQQMYLPPWSVFISPSDAPNAGDAWLFSVFGCAIHGEAWSRRFLEVFYAMISNKCGCRKGTEGCLVCECDGRCTPLVRAVLDLDDLTRGHFYFTNKNAAVPLANFVYTRGAVEFSETESGEAVTKAIAAWRDSGKVP